MFHSLRPRLHTCPNIITVHSRAYLTYFVYLLICSFVCLFVCPFRPHIADHLILFICFRISFIYCHVSQLNASQTHNISGPWRVQRRSQARKREANEKSRVSNLWKNNPTDLRNKSNRLLSIVTTAALRTPVCRSNNFLRLIINSRGCDLIPIWHNLIAE